MLEKRVTSERKLSKNKETIDRRLRPVKFRLGILHELGQIHSKIILDYPISYTNLQSDKYLTTILNNFNS